MRVPVNGSDFNLATTKNYNSVHVKHCAQTGRERAGEREVEECKQIDGRGVVREVQSQNNTSSPEIVSLKIERYSQIGKKIFVPFLLAVRSQLMTTPKLVFCPRE